MKITKKRLQRIIKEEIEAVVDEGMFSKMKSKMGFGSEKMDRAIKMAWQPLKNAKEQAAAAEDGKKFRAADLSGTYAEFDYALRNITNLRAKLGMNGPQETMWKGIKKDSFQILDSLRTEIEFAIESEEGEEAAEKAKNDMRIRHIEWMKAEQERKAAKEAAKPFVPSEKYTREMTSFANRAR